MARHQTADRLVRRSVIGLLTLIVGAAVLLGALGPAGPAAGQLPGTGEGIPAPATSLSPDGLSASDGVRTLSISQADGLDPAGQVITVSGSGYDDFKGVYVAFCVVPPTNQLPSPCGGGADLSGTGGASQWVSSNPPAYGEGLAIPYGPGGSFEVTLAVGPAISSSIDCRRVRCAVVTRNDHQRSTDRSQDILVPVTFGTEVVAEEPPVTEAPVVPAPEPTAPPVTEAPAVAETVPPETTTTAAPTTTTSTTVATGPDEMAIASATSDASGSSALWIVLAVLAVLAVAGVVVWLTVVRRRPSAR